MQLQGGKRPHVVDWALEALLQGDRFVRTRGHNDDFPGVHDGLDAHRQSHPRYSGRVIVEKARVGQDRIVRQGLDTCAAAQRRTGFIECDMSVGANSPEEQLDATITGNAGLERGAFCCKVWRISIQDVDVLWRYVDVGEEMLVHEAVVGFAVFTR